jgi:hypothetical protein
VTDTKPTPQRKPVLPRTAPKSNVISVCAWCPHLNILALDRSEHSHLLFSLRGKVLHVYRDGKELTVSHGCCPACSAKVRQR